MKSSLKSAAIMLAAVCSQTRSESLTAEQLAERAIQRRAVEAVVWGVPAVNYQRMLEAAAAIGAKPNQVVYWSKPLNAKTQTLTPNPDTIYFQPFYDTTNGPMVLEVPASEGDGVIVGSVDNAWQSAIEDVGIAGVDKGKGGKYLITPPGYQEKVPEGFIPMPSDTYRGFAILRSNYKSRSDADIAKAVEHGKRARLYPLGGDPDSTVFVDVYDKPYDATIPYDASFFESLDRFVQAEPWLTRDKVMINPLKTLGIVKGQSLKLDAKTRTHLDAAAKEARDYINLKYEAGFVPPFFEGTHWALPLEKDAMEGIPTNFADPNSFAIDGRAVAYSIAYFSAKHLGAGQFYLLSVFDKAGKSLEGKKTYRLVVPADAPVQQYWSVTAYDRETHALIPETSRSSRGSNAPDIQKNADGSTDIYFGPEAPAGKESNWVPTHGRDFELLFRFYGPEKALFEKTWKLPDLEEANQITMTSMKTKPVSLVVSLSLFAVVVSRTNADEPIRVTVDNFIRAESDLYFGGMLKDSGGAMATFRHHREPANIDTQTVIRLNRDTLYSSALFDLDAGPVTITFPDAGKRFMSMMLVNEDHYVPEVIYTPGNHVIDKAKIGTRYGVVAIRTLVDPADPDDIKQVHLLQDAIKIEQPGGPGKFEVPQWDAASQKKVRDALLVLASTKKGFEKAFGTKEQVNPINHLLGTAAGWGGNPDKDATYLNFTPAKNDGATPYKVVVKEVPVDSFWSISVYNKEGYFEKNGKNSYSVNNITAKKAADGSVTVLFGGKAEEGANHIPITPGWNYTVRLYRPRAEILDGTWKFPEPEPLK